MARWAVMEGGEAVARVAHALSEVIAIYPITPSSAMGEFADAWSAAGRSNLWGCVPEVLEMQSEGGAAGALHGAVTKGTLATTFTASQGLLLMVPNMYKIAGELTPAVIHVAARTVATHALSIFGDHSDVMGVRMTGWAMLCAGSVQQAHDFALVAHAATLRSRVPFVHFFDGFRTSHEINTIELLEDADLRALIRESDVLAHRERGLTPDRPVLRGAAENPDTFFQSREASNPFHDAVPDAVAACFQEFAERTGRRYSLVDYVGAPDADRVAVVLGSAAATLAEAARHLHRSGERVGVATIRLYRPFPARALLEALPPTVRTIAVLDRTKEPGAPAEPLHADVLAALDAHPDILPTRPRVIGGRYGLSSKEFTPAMAAAVFAEAAASAPRRRFTVGVTDDVTHLSLPVDSSFRPEHGALSAVFYGLGSDGTVGAAKNTVKIIGGDPGRHAQGYFVYDSRKSGATTVSHLRFADTPIDQPYLIDSADFVAVHHFDLLWSMKTLDVAAPGATVLLNTRWAPDQVWEHLPAEIQRIILDRRLAVWAIDATAVARAAGLGNRINTVMQPCFFHLSGVVLADQAVTRIKSAVEATYGRRGRTIVERNFAAIDAAIEALHPVVVPQSTDAGAGHRMPPLPAAAPDFVQRVTATMLRGEGDLLPVSALPPDGQWPTGTSAWEKRGIAEELPIWDASLCIDCGKCALVCPHAAIRVKVAPTEALADKPETLSDKPYKDRTLAGHRLIVQVAPDDCTGCGICVDVCPARSKTEVKHKSLNLRPAHEHRDTERVNYDFFLQIPEIDRSLVRHDQVKGVAQLQPLFEFSLACAGCGETPYLRTLTQVLGDRLIIANATGCSSIYGGNLPTTPYTTDRAGRGPAWSNSLFEDNAEFGLGLRLAWETQHAEARRYLHLLAPWLDPRLVSGLLEADQRDETQIAAQRERVVALREALATLATHPRHADPQHADPQHVAALTSLADELVEKSVWIVGGDGWAYDIGYGGLDHVLSTGRNVNILVLDTEVYSNTGGQASKATPRGAAAKFAASGKARPKKDLGMLATAYGHVYVAQLAIGANQQQTVRAMQEAAAWDGPSLLIAYSTCIAHGIDMATSMSHQATAVSTGYWPLYRYRPDSDAHAHPMSLDSKAPSRPVAEFMHGETRFSMLARSDPERAEHLTRLAQADVDARWAYYSQLAGLERPAPLGEHGLPPAPEIPGDTP